MRPKVLFLTPWYPDPITPHHGVFIRDQAWAVSERYDVTVICSKVDYREFKLLSWKIEESTYGKVTEYRIGLKRSIMFINQINYLLVSLWLSYKIAKAFRPDIIHGNIAYPGGIWSYCLARVLGRPFIVSDHTSVFTDNFRSSFHRAFTIFSMRRAAKVIAVSSWAAQAIELHIKRRVEVVPNLIHVDDYLPNGVHDRAAQIGFLGGLSTNRKGLDLLLAAVALIKSDFVLHVGGTGKYLEYYKELARALQVDQKCNFHGFVDHVPDFMKRLNFFISSSRTEAFGMVIVEAMASGLPVVTTDSGGPADFMEPALGIMVPKENVEALKDGIEWMIANYNKFDPNLIRAKVTTNFSPEAFLQRLDRQYQQVLLSASS